MAKAKKAKQPKTRAKYAAWLTDEGLSKLEAWARDGLTDEQISHNMGVARATLAKYKTLYPAIDEALKKGKEVVDIAVENALFKRAMGYEYQETTRERVKVSGPDGEVEYGMKVTKIVTKQVAPDVTAQIFWLKNRKPKEWRDRQEIENFNVNAEMTPDEARQYLKSKGILKE